MPLSSLHKTVVRPMSRPDGRDLIGVDPGPTRPGCPGLNLTSPKTLSQSRPEDNRPGLVERPGAPDKGRRARRRMGWPSEGHEGDPFRLSRVSSAGGHGRSLRMHRRVAGRRIGTGVVPSWRG